MIDGSFHAVTQAVALPLGRPAALDYLCGFIEEMKRCGCVAQALSGAA